jgi:enoyl-CoA hydratase
MPRYRFPRLTPKTAQADDHPRAAAGESSLESYQSIAVSQQGSLCWIVLNRTKRLNAFDPVQWRELEHALLAAGADPATRSVAVRGSGSNFSAGYDLPSALEELEGASPDLIRTHMARGNRACWAAWSLSKPVIAAVEGYCLGGAFEFAMACDFVLTDESGRFGEPEGRVAASAPFLVTPWVMGMRHAKEILLAGDVIGAARAERIGLVNEVCEAGGIEAAVGRWARKLAGFDAGVWAANKRALNRSYEIMGFSEAIAMGEDAFVELSYVPSPFRDELAHRVKHDGFSAAMKWVQSHYE